MAVRLRAKGKVMLAPFTTVEARVMGHVLAVVDRAAPAVPVDIETEPAAAVRDDAIILRSGGSHMRATVHFQRVASIDDPLPELSGIDLPSERVLLTWRVRSGELVIDELHRGATPVPEIGLDPGVWIVEVLVWGRSAASAYEDRLDEEEASPFPVGPEVWLLRFVPTRSA